MGKETYKPISSSNLDFNQKQIVFYDGYCSLCSFAVDFILPRDNNDQFLFAPLSGSTAQQYLPDALTKSPFTIVLFKLEAKKLYIKSDAALEIASKLSFPWNGFRFLSWVPRPVRDFFYMIISFIRYRILPKRETCRLPTPAERKKFLP